MGAISAVEHPVTRKWRSPRRQLTSPTPPKKKIVNPSCPFSESTISDFTYCCKGQVGVRESPHARFEQRAVKCQAARDVVDKSFHCTLPARPDAVEEMARSTEAVQRFGAPVRAPKTGTQIMSHRPINHNEDLSRLREEGYSIHIVGGYVVMRDVPFVDAEGRIGTGAIASVPKLAGDKIVGATDHTVLFCWRNSARYFWQAGAISLERQCWAGQRVRGKTQVLTEATGRLQGLPPLDDDVRRSVRRTGTGH